MNKDQKNLFEMKMLNTIGEVIDDDNVELAPVLCNGRIIIVAKETLDKYQIAENSIVSVDVGLKLVHESIATVETKIAIDKAQRFAKTKKSEQ